MHGPKLLRFLLLLLLLALGSALARAGNDYPLVLVHGFMGWGREELLGFKYWGGWGTCRKRSNGPATAPIPG